MTFIAYVFPKLPTTEDVLRKMPKRSRLRGPQDRRHGKRAEALFNINEIAFIICSDHCEGSGVAKVTLRDMTIL